MGQKVGQECSIENSSKHYDRVIECDLPFHEHSTIVQFAIRRMQLMIGNIVQPDKLCTLYFQLLEQSMI